MDITLASYFEPENHGKGRKIGITHDKPKNLENEIDYKCDLTYEGLAPDREDMINYYVERNKILREAGGWDFNEDQQERFQEVGEAFQAAYCQKLQEFVDFVNQKSKETGESIQDIVGLEDGDTLLSMEKGGNKTFRTITAEYLRKLGYRVYEK